MYEDHDRLSLLLGFTIVVAACISLVAVNGVAAEVTSAEIIHQWQEREGRIKTARVSWTQRRLDKQNAISFGEGQRTSWPETDVEFEHRYELFIDDSFIRLQLKGPEWFSGSTMELRDCSWVEVQASGICKSLRFTEIGGHQGIIETRPPNMLSHARSLSPWPIVWFLRPFEFSNREIFEGDRTLLTVLPESSDLVAICGSKDSPDLRLTLDATGDFLVRYVDAPYADVDVTYRNDSKYGTVPDRWTATIKNKLNEPTTVFTCVIDELELNIPIPPEMFQIDFPVGARITDASKRNKSLIVDHNGDLVPYSSPTFLSPTKRKANTTRLVSHGPLVNFVIGAILLLGVFTYRSGVLTNRFRLRLSLTEFLLLFLVLSPLLAAWTASGIKGLGFVAIWLLVGVTSCIAARQLTKRIWRVAVPLVACLLCGIVIAVSDGTLTEVAPYHAVFHITAGGLIGIACGMIAYRDSARYETMQ